MARIKLKYVNAFPNRRRKNERVRYYFRRRGFKAIPLPGLPGSEEFMTAYQMALAAIPDQERPEIGASRTEPGTINALVISYYRCAEWTNLADETRSARRRIIEKFRAKHGSKRVRLLSREHIVKMLAEITRPTAKRSWLKAIRGLLKHAVPTMRKDDPTEGIASITRVTFGRKSRLMSSGLSRMSLLRMSMISATFFFETSPFVSKKSIFRYIS